MFPKSNNIKDLKLFIIENLNSKFSNNEIKFIVKSLLLKITNIPYEKLLTQNDLYVNESDIVWIINALKKIKLNVPLQYVIGYEWFMGLKIFVNNSVLIPRPETEELVKLILDDNQLNDVYLDVIDLGTGSGCIPIALKCSKIRWNITAIDLYNDALEIAKYNAKYNNVEISFQINDILNFNYSNKQLFDIIVSNPPYVRNIEKFEMQDNVLKYEPHKALFVDDDNPLIYYKSLSKIAQNLLKENGKMYCEINENLGKEVCELFKSESFTNIEIVKDIFNKDRFVKIEM